jgi:GntR family transcriptional repressor for pyruvate dehydrogenase complex
MFTTIATAHHGTSSEEVVSQLQELIHQGGLRPGDRLPPERDLARQLGVSRPTLRTGIQALAAVGVIHSKQGAGNFVANTDENAARVAQPFNIQSWIYGFSSDEIFEAQITIEMDAAGRAAERASSQHLLEMIEEIVEMFASLDTPEEFLIHEIRFHQIIAAASGNQMLATLMNALYTVLFEQIGRNARWSTNLKEAAEFHRQIYQNIRNRDPEAARQIMQAYLLHEK